MFLLIQQCVFCAVLGIIFNIQYITRFFNKIVLDFPVTYPLY